MGYTHYWRRTKTIPKKTYLHIVSDFGQLLPLFKILDIKLADGDGKNTPVIDSKEVRFNGSCNCGHKKTDLGISWPASRTKSGVSPTPEKAVVGSWFAGALLQQRTCDGNCSHESFHFPQTLEIDQYATEDEETGLYFEFCKTAYKPYDLAVNCFLVIAKHYLKEKIKVSSDGEMKDWNDSMKICQENFGYGADFKLRE